MTHKGQDILWQEFLVFKTQFVVILTTREDRIEQFPENVAYRTGGFYIQRFYIRHDITQKPLPLKAEADSSRVISICDSGVIA